MSTPSNGWDERPLNERSQRGNEQYTKRDDTNITYGTSQVVSPAGVENPDGCGKPAVLLCPRCKVPTYPISKVVKRPKDRRKRYCPKCRSVMQPIRCQEGGRP